MNPTVIHITTVMSALLTAIVASLYVWDRTHPKKIVASCVGWCAVVLLAGLALRVEFQPAHAPIADQHARESTTFVNVKKSDVKLFEAIALRKQEQQDAKAQ